MSPEFILRPSLSVVHGGRCAGGKGVSPEFILRPSLSEVATAVLSDQQRSVAGVYTPAFVERRCQPGRSPFFPECVAGVYTPAFVERGARVEDLAATETRVAGVYTPAFVERRRGSGDRRRQAGACRRSLYSGLR